MSQDKEREALEAAWRECRDACDPSDWTASEAAAYRGFFAHGYRAALATQPPAVQGEPQWRDIETAPKQEDESGCLACVTCGQPAQAAQSAGEVERGDVVAFEFYNRATGHAIVDYSVNTHVGNLSADKGYEAHPLVYADKREEVTDGSKPIPLWQAREALDELEAAARGDAPFNHQAAAVVRAALSHKEPQR